MKFKILEEDLEGASGCSAACSAGGANLSVGSNIVNYGPNNPYLSNLEEYKRRKKSKKDDAYEREYRHKDTKGAGHSRKSNKHGRFHEPEGW